MPGRWKFERDQDQRPGTHHPRVSILDFATRRLQARHKPSERAAPRIATRGWLMLRRYQRPTHHPRVSMLECATRRCQAHDKQSERATSRIATRGRLVPGRWKIRKGPRSTPRHAPPPRLDSGLRHEKFRMAWRVIDGFTFRNRIPWVDPESRLVGSSCRGVGNFERDQVQRPNAPPSRLDAKRPHVPSAPRPKAFIAPRVLYMRSGALRFTPRHASHARRDMLDQALTPFGFKT